VKVRDADEAVRRIAGQEHKILVTRTLDSSFEGVLPKLKGLIVEEYISLPPEDVQKLQPDIVVIASVPDACATFENGLTVTLDGEEKLIYDGIVEEKNVKEEV
jgi:phosphohistidine swiveling domain-containing protein